MKYELIEAAKTYQLAMKDTHNHVSNRCSLYRLFSYINPAVDVA